ncbi:MAG: hypothetical protein WKF45_09985 [Ilumatobacteraceae bacterium]
MRRVDERIELDRVVRPVPLEPCVTELIDELVRRSVLEADGGDVDVDRDTVALVGVDVDDDEDRFPLTRRIGLRVAQRSGAVGVMELQRAQVPERSV